jgi:SAM-dependent methyltransferase
MDAGDIEKIQSRYRERIIKNGYSPSAIGEPKGRQAFYFEFIQKFDGLKLSDSIVDIGCGFGDFYGYMTSKGWRGDYLGIDIVPELIDEAKRRYPNARFSVQDIQEQRIPKIFDWCISCHALSSDTAEKPFLSHFEEMINLMWAACNRGLVFNMLSPLADYTNPIHARPPISSIIDVITKLTGRFTIRHDYMPYEYAVYLYKENKIDPSLLIFDEHRLYFNEVNSFWRPGLSSKNF